MKKNTEFMTEIKAGLPHFFEGSFLGVYKRIIGYFWYFSGLSEKLKKLGHKTSAGGHLKNSLVNRKHTKTEHLN